MDTFFPITCLVLIATVAANGGYNYQQQNSRPFASVNTNAIYSPQQAPPLAPQVSAPSQVYGQPSTQYLGPVQQQSSYSSNFGGGSSYQSQQSGHYGGGGGGGGGGGSGSGQYHQQQTIISKDIYIHSAPEETEEIRNVLGGAEPAPLRKNYRILFIKAPSHNIRFNTQYIKQTQAANEEKTVIYVLSKKPDIANIQNEVASGPVEHKATKPEVYFIRYKTHEEAQRAQQEIQAQYEALGGSTQISDEGVGPVTSVIGNGSVGGGSSGGSNFAQSASSNQPLIAQSSNQQQFRTQQSFQGGQGGGFGKNYLPPKRI